MKKKMNSLCLVLSGHRKFFRAMRISLFLILISALQVLAGASYSQSTRLSLNMKNVTVKDVLFQIEEQSEFYFLYNSELIDVQRKVDFNVQNEKVEVILTKLFGDGKVDAMIRDRHIILTPADESAMQQNRKVTGKITDSSGSPLPGATVAIKGTAHGTITDNNGNYTISDVPENATLQFSFVGMMSQELTVAGKTTVNVTMVEEAIGIDEVVAVGYGTQKKATVTGSIATMKGAKLMASPSSNVATSLQGRLPGLVVNVRTGDPGNENTQILIRGKATLGSNNVLTVIDGVPSGDIQRLNPADIESISILKDASAAIYGAQAANGVILVTTKRGKIGKPTVSYNGNFGVTQPTRLSNLLDSWEYAIAENEYLVNSGLTKKWTDQDITLFQNGSDPLQHPNVDWNKEVLRTWTPQQQHNLSLSGGTESVKYFLSGQLIKQERNFNNSDGLGFQQQQLRANIDAQVIKHLSVGLDMNYKEIQDEQAYEGSGNQRVVFGIHQMQPQWPAFYPNGLPGPATMGLNPAVMGSSSKFGYNRQKSFGFNSKISFKLDLEQITKGLFIEGFGNFNNVSQSFEKFKLISYFYTYDPATGNYIQQRAGQETTNPDLRETSNQSHGKILNVKIGYQHTFGKHSIDAFAATEQSTSNYSGFWAYRKDYLIDQLPVLSAGNDVGKDNSGYKSSTARLNYFGRINYGFDEKYLVSATLRYDGSANFPEDKRFGLFPGVSAGWVLSKESFIMDNYKFVSLLKLKGSWGKMGNDAVPPFQYLATYKYGGGYYLGAPSTQKYPGFTQATTPNPNITWEVAETWNVGLESVLWNGLLGFNLDLFKSERSDILTKKNASTPGYTGLVLPDMNIGIVGNSGFEIALTHSKAITSDFSYAVDANMSYAHNKVIFFDESPNVSEYQKKTGYPIDSWLVYQPDGIYQNQAEIDATPHLPNTAPGDIKYLDINKDGKIDASDMARETLSPTPEIMYGINLSAKYKNWELSLLLQGQARSQVLLRPEGLNMDKVFYDGRWQKEGDNLYPRSFNSNVGATGNNALNSTFWLKDGSFMRLKNVQLAYTLPEKITDPVHLSNVRMFVSGTNLLMIYDQIKIVDPELLNNITDNLSSYPIQRVINFGVNVSF